MGAISYVDAFMELLFGQNWKGFQETLARFAIQWLFYATIICMVIVFVFSLAKVMFRKALWRRGLFTFFRRYWDSIALLSLFIVLFNIAVAHNALFEYLVFLVMWAQLEAGLILWRIEVGPHLQFKLRGSGLLRKIDEPFMDNVTGTDMGWAIVDILVKNLGRVPVYHIGLVRVLEEVQSPLNSDRSYIPLKPEVWREHMSTFIASLPPNGESVIATIDALKLERYLDRIVFEICYSTPLQPMLMSECVYVKLVKIVDATGKTYLDIVSSGIGFTPRTPLVKIYEMLFKEIPSLLVGLWRLRRFESVYQKEVK